jgi:hypothetical protein
MGELSRQSYPERPDIETMESGAFARALAEHPSVTEHEARLLAAGAKIANHESVDVRYVVNGLFVLINEQVSLRETIHAALTEGRRG